MKTQQTTISEVSLIYKSTVKVSDIKLPDHLILTTGDYYYSFAENGLL